jgi:hypothetical protein
LGAIRVLAKAGTINQVMRSGETPLVDALNFPDGQVQFEAAVAILETDPTTPFPAAPRIVAILARALTDDGSRRAVVIDANLNRANTVAGFLRGMGYDPYIARTGREGFELAADLAAVEFIAVQSNVVRWGLSQTVSNLRADARTAAIPIAIYGPEELEDNVTGLLGRTDRAAYLHEATTTDLFVVQLRPFLAQFQTPAPSPDRQPVKEQAAHWLAFIASGRRTEIYDLRPAEAVLAHAVLDPAVSNDVLAALTAVPTTTAQRTFYEMAVSPTTDLVLRRAAAVQLAVHIQRHGVLLTKDQIAALTASWRDSGDPSLATALAAATGAIRNYDRPHTATPPDFPVPALPVR